jgi:hypothetical protein
MIDQVIVPFIDPLTLDSIFPTPGRNESCSCGSGEKYKKCCLAADEEAWRAVAQMRREADAVLAMLRAMPKSIYPEYNLES